MNNENKQLDIIPKHTSEALSPETLRLSELWRNEPWARIQSNMPYGIPEDDTIGERQRLGARTAFLSGDSSEPELTYPRLDMVDLGSAIVRFDEMITKLKLRPEENPLLFESVSDKIAELSRHRYVLEAVQATTDEERNKYLNYAEQLAVEVFGDVEPARFNTLLADLTETASSTDTQYSRELLDLLPGVDPNLEKVVQETLKPETIAKLEPLIRQYLAPMFEIVDALPDGEFEHERSIEVFQSCIDALGLDGVRAILTMGNALDADGFTMTIGLGRNRAKLTRETFLTVGIHELIHIIGSYEGQKQEDDVISIGLPKSLSFEEGKCVAVEQIVTGKATKRGEPYYFALGLLKGTIDGMPRTFRQVHEILWRKTILSKKGEITDDMVAGAKKSAYQTCMRITRGHAADTRDLAYYNGNDIASGWFNQIAELPNDQALATVEATLSTKADPTNPVHLEHLEQHHPKWQQFTTMGASEAKTLLKI
ncbi:MAG: hypothetical protein JWO99_705 [Candidatus Saccharibacteria bacterium]|nr:hypothetical protein [Candidatus Saccharibacteria bacterium]